ncbi:uncharacterized protein TNCV_1283581 [Trichonephila clavipes]|uniref:Uncharacterized protein n=1 Tax=Trichonephila clavipes TaxID=2585209 RepID=A0A8X6VP28_TRICX|nr:uncharacterized protein TNCV_1283581 [Trichonephila clavipes]
MAPRPLHQLCGQCDVEQCEENCTAHQGASTPVHGYLECTERALDLRFASARCLEIVCGTIATPTSARIVERVTVGFTSACRTILRSFLLVVFLVAPDTVFRAWVPSRVHYSQQFLTAHSERSTWPATRRVDQPSVLIPMIRPLSNSLNCEKCLLARLPGMLRLPKSSYNRRGDGAGVEFRPIDSALRAPLTGYFYIQGITNPIDKFRGMVVRSTGMTNHHRTWDRKPRFFGENRDNSCQEDDQPNECGDLQRRGRVEETCTYANFPVLELLQRVLITTHQNVRFMHDDAPAYRLNAVLHHLHATYSGRWIGYS